MPIDTLKYVQQLEKAGVDRKAAEAHANAMREVVIPDMATKADLTNLEERLKTAMLTNSLGLLLAIFTIGGFLIRFVK